MIITVTLNPAMDRTVLVEELVLGEVNRVRQGRSDPGGKGINVSRVVRELGYSSLAMGFVAGSIGRFIEASLNEIGIQDDFVHVPGQTRTNLSIVESRSRRQTSVNEPGPETDVRWAKALSARVSRRLSSGDWLVLAGSIPPGVPKSVYAELIQLARAKQAVVVLDADGEAFVLGVAAKPQLIKPNQEELERLLGRNLSGDDDVAAAAMGLRQRGVEYVIVSMGSRGALALGPHNEQPGETIGLRGYAPKVEAQSTIGAGDSLVAGVVISLSQGKSLREALRLGMAAGAATAMTPGTMLCRAEDVERLVGDVRIDDFSVTT